MSVVFEIPLKNASELVDALRELPMRRPRSVLISSVARMDEAVCETLARFRLPHYVAELYVKIASFPTKKLAETVIKLIANGPGSLHIGNWPGDQIGGLLDALVDKKDLATLSIPVRNFIPSALATLAMKLQSLEVRFLNFTDTDWTELGRALAISSTLTELTLMDYVPETAFPPHLPINLHTFEVASKWAISFEWLSHGYWPTRMEKLKCFSSREFPELPELTETMKARIRDIPFLSFAVGKEPVLSLCDILASENRIDNLSITRPSPLNQLMRLLTSPFAFMSTLTICHELDPAEGSKLWDTIRGKTRTQYWELLGNEFDWLLVPNEWFQVMQTLLSVYEIPRLRIGSLAGLVPWGDHILRIVRTLGWPLQDYYDEGYEDYD